MEPSDPLPQEAATRSKRWERRREARPGEIVEAALDCFNERGFSATKLDDVAKRAGVTKGTVYLYFASKEDLFKAAVRESLLPRIDHVLAGATAGPDDPAETIRRVLLTFVEEVLPTPAGIIPKLIISEAKNFPEIARYYFDEVICRVRKLLTGLIRGGIAAGDFRPVDPDLIFFSLVSPMLIAALWRQSLEPFDKHPLDVRALVGMHLDLLFRGLAPGTDDNTPVSDQFQDQAASSAGPASGSESTGRRTRQP